MVVVGPEEPLVKGIVDYFAADPSLRSIPVIGPSATAAQLEGSKAFSKKFMDRYGIPTAAYREFNNNSFAEGIAWLQQHSLPIVLSGIELSVFVLLDGRDFLILPEAKDYKRAYEDDKGPNTGGMGAVSPVPFADVIFMDKVITRIIIPTVNGLKTEGIDYRGFLFVGVIKVGDDPYVIEYNCRMGDPETEVVMPRLTNDLVELFNAVSGQSLRELQIRQEPRTACTVVAVSGGYPGPYQKGLPITGLDQSLPADSLIFHAGTRTDKEGIVTNGGRVLCVTSFADTVYEAVDRSRDILEKIYYEGIYYRRDIGYEFL
jgi:phosphoribosylamine--glycine ligase